MPLRRSTGKHRIQNQIMVCKPTVWKYLVFGLIPGALIGVPPF